MIIVCQCGRECDGALSWQDHNRIHYPTYEAADRAAARFS